MLRLHFGLVAADRDFPSVSTGWTSNFLQPSVALYIIRLLATIEYDRERTAGMP
jgi:hypothetical protein